MTITGSTNTLAGKNIIINKKRFKANSYTEYMHNTKGNVKARANERNMLRSFVHQVGLCCMMLAYVAYSLKLVKLFAQHMPTFLLFSGDR